MTQDPEKHNLLNYGIEEDKRKCLQAEKRCIERVVIWLTQTKKKSMIDGWKLYSLEMQDLKPDTLD